MFGRKQRRIEELESETHRLRDEIEQLRQQGDGVAPVIRIRARHKVRPVRTGTYDVVHLELDGKEVYQEQIGREMEISEVVTFDIRNSLGIEDGIGGMFVKPEDDA